MVGTLTFGTKSTPSSFVSSHAVSQMFQASGDLRRVIDRDEGCEDFWSEVFPDQSRLVLSYVVEAFSELGCDLATTPAGSLVAPVGILPKHAMVQRILFQVLETEGLVELHGREGYRRTSKPLVAVPSAAVLASLVRHFPQWAVTHQLHNVTGSALSQCLTGERNAMQLVFGLNKQLIGDFYTKAPFFAAASRQLTEFLRAVLTDFASGRGRRAEPIEILEVGAGMGGTTVYVLAMLAELGVPFRYTYTDISQSLVTQARRRWAHLGDAIEFAVLDITRDDLPAARLGRFHVVLSSNCVHATPSLRASTTNIRKMLRPDGVMALIELTTRLAMLDLLFGFFDSWWLFQDGRQHALADVDFWRRSLEEAGFGTTEGVLEKPKSKDGPINPQLIIAINDRI